MKTLCSLLFLCFTLFSFAQHEQPSSYWKHSGKKGTKLAQLITTLNDQGDTIHHINVFLPSCKTRMYYATYNVKKDEYVITNSSGEASFKRYLAFKRQKTFIFKNQKFKQISFDTYKKV